MRPMSCQLPLYFGTKSWGAFPKKLRQIKMIRLEETRYTVKYQPMYALGPALDESATVEAITAHDLSTILPKA